jgi:hypothetical protein
LGSRGSMFALNGSNKLQINVPAFGDASSTVYFGVDNGQLAPVEVLVTLLSVAPSVTELREAYKWRKNNQNRTVAVAVVVNGKAHLFGPSEDRQPVIVDTPLASRILQSALSESSPTVARRHLVEFFDNLGNSEMAGIKNKGLFASHHLRENLPKRKDWKDLQTIGQALASKRHRELIESLGYTVSGEERNTLILRANTAENRVIAVLLDDAENFDSPSGRFPSSPVAWGLSVAADHNVPWLIVLKKDQIRLHPGRDGVGVGQKGQAETYLELNLAQIETSHLALLPLIFSARSLERGGDVQLILEESSKYAVVLGARLRERVYASVVPNISIAVAKKLKEQGVELNSEGLQKAYSITLKILFRLLFQAYAEDRGLLPSGRNEGYDANSLKTIAKRDIDASPDEFGQVVSIWYDLIQVWDAIDGGNPRWQVPAYNGGLFGRDPVLHPEGALIKGLDLPDSVMGPALQALLIDMTEDGVKGPVDFRSLSVREFGTIYEGLLESSLSLAEVDLTVDIKETWVPAKAGDNVIAKAGDPYFHSASGERKATGSYFTPKFVVDHLVERAIDPTLDKHLERIAAYLRSGDQATASREFFDFRVADLAMGSAHFLVAAVDRIEAKMRAFLANPATTVPGVVDEILRLRKAAIDALGGDEIAINEIEDPSLLRRQIARRCIYGLDINAMAVELARLAIWIHTFVPGLPMSALNHNLVCANSLTGIATIDEALETLMPTRNSQPGIADDEIENDLERARGLLQDAANASEANKAEVIAAADLARRARQESANAKLFFDCALATRMGLVDARLLFQAKDILAVGASQIVQDLIQELIPAHFPYLFPEVFLRSNPGFDALLGNPPWEKAQVEEHSWWGLRIPGLRGMPMVERKHRLESFRASRPELEKEYQAAIEQTNKLRTALLRGPYEGLGSSNVDLYQAFAWRNWNSLRKNGRFGLVLPRGAMSGTALSQWRKQVLEQGNFADVTFASNNRHWIFENVHASYAVAFVVAEHSEKHFVQFSGPARSIEELKNIANSRVNVPVEEFQSWTLNSSFPQLPDYQAFEIFRVFKRSNRLGDQTPEWDFGVVQGDFNATTNRDVFELGPASEGVSVPVYAGASFNLWNPKYGVAYGHASDTKLRNFLLERLRKSSQVSKSAYFNRQFSRETLPMDKPRIGFRDITNATNTRTTIVALLPPGIVGTHRVSFLVNRTGQTANEAFLLGIMSSIPYDWYMRRVVEMVLNFEILRSSPVPFSEMSTEHGKRLTELSVRLACTDERFAVWAAEAVTHPFEPLDVGQKFEALCEIDALAAIMFGLERNQVSHIFATFHRGWDYKDRLEKVLHYFDDWKGK